MRSKTAAIRRKTPISMPPDRNWWVAYMAGIQAYLDKLPCVPPDHFTEGQKDAWREGFHR